MDKNSSFLQISMQGIMGNETKKGAEELKKTEMKYANIDWIP